MEQKRDTLIENVSKAGKANVAKHGREHMAAIASIGRENLRKRDPGYFIRLAASGLHAREVKKQAEIAKMIGDTSTVKRLLNLLIRG